MGLPSELNVAGEAFFFPLRANKVSAVSIIMVWSSSSSSPPPAFLSGVFSFPVVGLTFKGAAKDGQIITLTYTIYHVFFCHWTMDTLTST